MAKKRQPSPAKNQKRVEPVRDPVRENQEPPTPGPDGAGPSGPPEPPTTQAPAEAASPFPHLPSPLILTGLAALVILGGHLGAHYLADPASIPRPWRGVAGWTAGIVIFLAASTLTQIIAIFLTPVRLPSTRHYLEFVGSFSAIGAILGVAMGFRGAEHLFSDAGRDAGQYGLPDFLSTVGNDVTLTTLVMVALCWPYTLLLVAELVKANRERFTYRGRRIPGAKLASLIFVLYGNLTGANTAAFAYQLLTRYR